MIRQTNKQTDKQRLQLNIYRYRFQNFPSHGISKPCTVWQKNVKVLQEPLSCFVCNWHTPIKDKKFNNIFRKNFIRLFIWLGEVWYCLLISYTTGEDITFVVEKLQLYLCIYFACLGVCLFVANKGKLICFKQNSVFENFENPRNSVFKIREFFVVFLFYNVKKEIMFTI